MFTALVLTGTTSSHEKEEKEERRKENLPSTTFYRARPKMRLEGRHSRDGLTTKRKNRQKNIQTLGNLMRLIESGRAIGIYLANCNMVDDIMSLIQSDLPYIPQSS
jgi:hypothetical protein